jgi:hypothetical protein
MIPSGEECQDTFREIASFNSLRFDGGSGRPLLLDDLIDGCPSNYVG